MSRYIDADALIKELKRQYMFLFGTEEIPNGIGMLIENFPTADVVEVVHGENISKSGFLCSVCKFGDFNGFHGYEPNFCPNCGADMKGGQNELHKRL